MKLSGAECELRHGYFVAAALSQWSFTGDRDGGTFTASVRSSDAYRLEQPGLSVVVPFGNGRLRWPILAMQITGGALTATLGARGE